MRLLESTLLALLLACFVGCGGGSDPSVVGDQSDLEAYVSDNAEAVANLEAFEADAEMEEEEDE